MTFEKTEVKTGILVVLTIGFLVLVLLLLGAPGLFRPEKSFKIFFDNASGLKPGASVLLAGRKVGQVTSLYSPVPKNLRPPKAPDAEVYIEVRMDRSAKVYRDANPRMNQLGLLGEQVIDFIEGNESTGLAENGYTFVGQRTPDFSESIPRIIHILEPVASTATLTLDDLRKAIASLNSLVVKDGPLEVALNQFKQVGTNLTTITSKDGALQSAVNNIKNLAAGLTDPKGPFQTSLSNFKKASTSLSEGDRIGQSLTNLRETTSSARELMSGIKPSLMRTAANAEEFTAEVKENPSSLLFGKKNKPQPKASPTPQTTTKRLKR